MKELSIEQKAKRYDEAIEIAKEINNEHKAQTFDVMLKVFPEIKESEDERVRKALVDGFKRYGDGALFNGCLVRNIVAWLEKQGEQKPVWSEDDETVLNNLIWALKEDKILGDRDEYVSWLNSLKDRVLPQPKQEWSEEDEKIKGNLQSELTNLAARQLIKGNTYDKYYKWLKSLCPPYYCDACKLKQSLSHWKPSDEQIEALESATENCAYSEYQDCLRELIGQLKKLKA